VSIESSRRNPDGSTGVGSVVHITEMLGGNPDYLVDVHTEVVKLDETGFTHCPRIHGLRLALMDYDFVETDEGTLYNNSLTVGVRGVLGNLINPLLRRFAFDERHGHAWIKHNIEKSATSNRSCRSCMLKRTRPNMWPATSNPQSYPSAVSSEPNGGRLHAADTHNTLLTLFER
jgi:hypothetical protein